MVSYFLKKDGGRYAGVLILIVMDNGLLPEAEFILSLSSLLRS